MPWGNSWSGGGEVVANSVQVVNGNKVVAAITPDGDITGNNLTANNDVILAGESLTRILGDQPEGIIAQTSIPAANLPTASYGATESAVMELDLVLHPGRMYQAYLSNMEVQTSGSPCRPVVRVRYTTDGTTPSISSPRLFETWADLDTVVSASDFAVPNGQSRIFQVGSQVTMRLLMTSQNQIITSGAAQQTHQFIGLDSGAVPHAGAMMAVNDLGPAIPDTGVYLGGTGGGSSTPTPVFKSFDFPCYDSQSYQGGGAASNGSGGSAQTWMYYGQDPGYSANGDWRSYAWFDRSNTSGGNGLGSLNDLSGVAVGNLSYLDVYVTTTWWYRTAGGNLYCGHTTNGVNHSREPGGTYQEKQIPYSSRGQGQWFSMLGTALATAVLNGSFQGIILGPGASGNYNDYGYAPGSAGPGQARIRAGYYK